MSTPNETTPKPAADERPPREPVPSRKIPPDDQHTPGEEGEHGGGGLEGA